jgi:hypothetical protein
VLTALTNKLLVILGNRAQRNLLKHALEARDGARVRQILIRLSSDFDYRVRFHARGVLRLLPTQSRSADDESIRCPDPICRVEEGEQHAFACMWGTCPHARPYVCDAPTRLLRRDEVSLVRPDWIVPEPSDRPSPFFVRLPSRCDQCGATHPLFAGDQ